MRVADVMTVGVQTVRATTPASQARDLMRIKGIHHLVVTDRSGLVGVVSARDLSRAGRSPFQATVAAVMSPQVVTIDVEAPVKRAANVMRGRSIGSLLVERSGRIVGIITVADLLELVGGMGKRPVERGTRWTIHHRVPHKKRTRSAGAW